MRRESPSATARREILLRGAIGTAGIVLRLGTVTRSARVLGFFLLNVQLAMAGGVLAVLVSTWFGEAGGGLAASTPMNLLLLPVLSARYGRFERAESASS